MPWGCSVSDQAPQSAGHATLAPATLAHMLRYATDWLGVYREQVNALNVYPVPDGDTGTNMHLTMQSVRRELDTCDENSMPGVARAISYGALLGARGNSGVILSQMLRGLAEALEGQSTVDCPTLSAALGSAARAAYDAVTTPVEGTMLTVMREGAAAAADAAQARAEIDQMMTSFVAEAHRSVERTPDLLPRLRDAGVVDAGGLGVAILFEGVKHGLTGEPLPEPLAATAQVELEGVEHTGHGYCTEFVILGQAIDRRAFARALAEAGGDSILVVGDPDAMHVHVHMEDPGPALSAGVQIGALTSIKVDNMQAQHEEWTEGHEREQTSRPPAELPAIGLVAVARGPGITAAFRDLGATRVLGGGPTGKASAGELLEAARGAGRDHVFLLPNDKDVLMAAEQAARESEGLVTVIPARTVAAGLAAAVAYMPEGDPAEIGRRMVEAIAGVHAVEVTTSVRDAVVDGVTVKSGEAIVLVDGVLVASAATLEEALLAGMERAVSDAASLVTLYLGNDAPVDARERIPALIGEAYPALEVEVVAGGQPFYPYVLSVE